MSAPRPPEPALIAESVAAEEYEPPVLFGMFFPEDLATLAADLEQIRKRLCLYGPAAQTCDCKYISGGTVGQGERSGCCEVRAASRLIGSSEAKMVTQLQKENARLRRALANVERAVAYAARGEHSDGAEGGTAVPVCRCGHSWSDHSDHGEHCLTCDCPAAQYDGSDAQAQPPDGPSERAPV